MAHDMHVSTPFFVDRDCTVAPFFVGCWKVYHVRRVYKTKPGHMFTQSVGG
jgi:mannose/cellobiose epimerase-like protein (N-acyl-D-glucosamine 2-epimerase family)